MSAGWRRKFEPSGFFVLRTPLLSFDEFAEWGAQLEAPAAADEGQLARALAADRARLGDRLKQIMRRPDVREALLLASPALSAELDASVDAASQRAEKRTLSVIRYFTRMTSRATPFGLMASCSVGKIDATTQIQLAQRQSLSRHTRLDMDYLCALAQGLQQDAELRRKLRYFPNSSLYRLDDRLRYVEWKLDESGRTYHLVAVEATDYLIHTIERARRGATPVELADALAAADKDVSANEGLEYIDSLIDSQLLVCEIEPPVTGPEPLDGMIKRLAPHAPDPARTLERAAADIEALDSDGIGLAPERYDALVERLTELPARVERSRLLQVDLHRPVVHATLGPALLDEIGRGVEVLHRLVRGELERLTRFRDAFYKRYEEREVPLVEALDEDIGIGFDTNDEPGADPSPLLDGLNFPSTAAASRVTWDRREVFLLRRLADALRSGSEQIELSQADIDAIATGEPPPLPDAFAVLARVAGRSEEAVRAGDFRISIDLASGPSGAMLLGRFCHGDAGLKQRVLDHLRAEEGLRPDAVFAEIVHLPEGRMGNVLLRPVLRDYEIPYLGMSAAPDERQIPITDLTVAIVGERIVVRSRRLGREVVPRLTSAHNFHRRSLSVYRFLCTLQAQGVAAGLAWSWGPLEGAPFLPRVTHGRLVLARARWLLSKKETSDLAAQRDEQGYARVQRWRRERRVPRFVALSEVDNELLIDFDNVLCVDTFLRQIATRDSALLLEPFPPPDELFVRGPEGRYTHEIVVPFVAVRSPTVAAAASRSPGIPARTLTRSADHSVRRSYPPGSEWLYLKLYGGVGTADRVLRTVIRPLVNDALAAGVAERWFFLRYSDPDWHLRVRLHGRPQPLYAWMMKRLSGGDASAQGQIARLALDTYEREIERYGGPAGIELAETVFHADSEAVLAMLESFEGDTAAEDRWQLALYGADRMLADMKFDLPTKRGIVRTLRESFEREFRVDASFRRNLAERFRPRRTLLSELLDGAAAGAQRLSPYLAILDRRSRDLAAPLAELGKRAVAGELTVSLEQLAISFIHMYINRLVRSAQRAHELVIYFSLERLYDSRLARSPSAADGAASGQDRT